MKKNVTAILIAMLVMIYTAGSLCAGEIPKPDKNGDYKSKTGHMLWVVVDDDPNGLNGRLSNRQPMFFYAPREKSPGDSILDWPVIRRFKKGDVLIANTTPAGFALTTDNRGLPWLKVNIGAIPTNDSGGEVICYVRANSKFIRPVKSPKNWSGQTLPLARINDPDGYTNVRSGPGSDYAIIERIQKHQPFIVLNEKGKWHKIFTPEKRTGYVHNSRIDLNFYTMEAAYGAAVVSSHTNRIKLHTGPSTGHPVAGHVNDGQLLYLLIPPSENEVKPPVGSWTKAITTRGRKGFVNLRSLKWIPMTKEI